VSITDGGEMFFYHGTVWFMAHFEDEEGDICH